jgi:dihydroorotate dehydrogenase
VRAQMMQAEFAGQGKSLSGIGGVETGTDAAEFILLGASTVQVCTGGNREQMSYCPCQIGPSTSARCKSAQVGAGTAPVE